MCSRHLQVCLNVQPWQCCMFGAIDAKCRQDLEACSQGHHSAAADLCVLCRTSFATSCTLAVRHLSSVAGTCLLRIGRAHCSAFLDCLSGVPALCHEPAQLRLLSVSGSARKIQAAAVAEHANCMHDDAAPLPKKVSAPGERWLRAI